MVKRKELGWEMVVRYFKMVSQNFPGVIEKTHENPWP
jgi:hypothetical protein